jgi:hypothetical protein
MCICPSYNKVNTKLKIKKKIEEEEEEEDEGRCGKLV